MTKYFAWITGLRGPEAQLWYDKPTDGYGKPKPSLAIHEIEDDDKRSFRDLVKAYPAPGEANV